VRPTSLAINKTQRFSLIYPRTLVRGPIEGA
jgi:hypothetical protein